MHMEVERTVIYKSNSIDKIHVEITRLLFVAKLPLKKRPSSGDAPMKQDHIWCGKLNPSDCVGSHPKYPPTALR